VNDNLDCEKNWLIGMVVWKGTVIHDKNVVIVTILHFFIKKAKLHEE
jgi:hypothetical protein